MSGTAGKAAHASDGEELDGSKLEVEGDHKPDMDSMASLSPTGIWHGHGEPGEEEEYDI